MAHTDPNPSLQRTPLYALHESLGARIVPFAGFAMPLQYRDGIIKEHLHTRAQAGLFDVSHMGQIRVAGRTAPAALETVLPIDVVGLAAGRQRYGFLTNREGGIRDDLMIANLGDGFLLVVNAACKTDDLVYLQQTLADRCDVTPLTDRALLAIQGPLALEVLSGMSAQLATLRFMDVAELELAGTHCYVSRSGYTGEDGFEISLPASDAAEFAQTLLRDPRIAPIGLGARDTLRLEAGLCLYGQDIDATTSPVEASLSWALSRPRRAAGARPGGYPGAARILAELASGTARRRVGLLPRARVPVRSGTPLVDAGGAVVGNVTSGAFGPSLGAPVAMGYVAERTLAQNLPIAAIVRGTRIEITVTDAPPVPHRYARQP